MAMTNHLDQLVNLGELTNTPAIPLVSESVVAKYFRDNKGVIKEKPHYVATTSSYGIGHIVLPPGAMERSADTRGTRVHRSVGG